MKNETLSRPVCPAGSGSPDNMWRGAIRCWFRLVLLLAAGCALTGNSYATILVFDQSRDATGSTVVATAAGSDVQQDYGDRVTGSPMAVAGGQFTYGNGGEGFTPNVVVDYFSGADVGLWTVQYGDLTNVLFARAPLSGTIAGSLNVRLTADPGYQVQLYHFDLAGWPNADYTIDAVNIFGNGATLFSLANVLVEGDANGPRHTSFDFSSPLTAAQLLIQIDIGNIAASSQDNIGMDNIRFGQTPPAAIPVPAASVLFGSGLVLLAARFRRRPARRGARADGCHRGTCE